MTENLAERSTVLVIDHSVDVHRVLKIRLRDQNLMISTALSATEGLKDAQEMQPDLILLESNMPEMSGFDVLAVLKDQDTTVHIPVILLSESDESQQKVRALDLGAVDWVTKPFDVPELRARVRSALRTQRLVKMLAQRAQVDGLTGLWNRAYFDRQIRQVINTSKRHGRCVSLILADLDCFKSVNDRFGHPFGDEVIQGFAQHLEEGSRSSDMACRIGGEEFAAILPETSAEAARDVAERYRSRFEATVWSDHDDLRLTVSIGIASLQDLEVQDAKSLIEAADRALYQAKGAGRNRVEIAGPSNGKPIPGPTPIAGSISSRSA